MRRIAPILIWAAIAFGPPALCAPPTPETGRALLLGAETSRAHVLFRRLDDAPIIWASPTSLGSKLSVLPGHHELGVMCEFRSSGAKQSIPGNLPIDVEAGHVYEIAGSLERDGRSCNLTVSKRS